MAEHTAATDPEFTDYMLTKVEESPEGWSLTLTERPGEPGHTGFYLLKQYGAAAHGLTPKVGDAARLYGGLGRPIRGVSLNGQEVYYRTPEEQRAEWKRDQEQQDAASQAEFESHREEYDRRIAALPAPFWRRFERFRRNREDFRWRQEQYELFCCEQAVVIAAQVATWGEAERLKLIAALPDGEVDALLKVAGTEPEPLSLLRLFHALPYEQQLACISGLSDEHSGNTFGFSCRLASLWLTRPELVPLEHGALCVLVGCEEYGCRPLTPAEEAEFAALAAACAPEGDSHA